MAASADPTLGFLVMFAAGVVLVVVILAFIVAQVIGEHRANVTAPNRHGHA